MVAPGRRSVSGACRAMSMGGLWREHSRRGLAAAKMGIGRMIRPKQLGVRKQAFDARLQL